MRIDFRKKNQRINRVYIFKEVGGWGVGINGTHHHYKCCTKNETKLKVSELLNIK